MKRLLLFLGYFMAICAVGCLSATSIHAQESAVKWSPAQQMKYRSIGGTDISADGKYVAYVVRDVLMEGEKSEYVSQIWIAATDGSFNEQYTRNEKSSYAPQFSPDGKKIAFLSTRDKKPQIFVMRLMGGEPVQVTDVKSGVSSFKWSPDGSTFFFTQTDPPSEEEEKQEKEKTDVILVDKNYKFTHLYKIDVAGKEKPKQLTSGAMDVNAFSISPDGKKVVFSYGKDPTINTNFLDTDIALVPADSGSVDILVSRPGNDQNPVFSPDGKYLAFETTNGKAEPIGLSDVSLLELGTKKIKPLPQTPDRNASIISWDPSGTKLYFGEVYHTSGTIMAMDINTASPSEKPVKVNSKNSLTGLEGTSGGFSLSKNGSLSYVFQTPDKPQEVFVRNMKTGESMQLSHVNDGIETPAMGRTELLTWKSKDGLEIEGLLTYPVGYEKGKKYPVILNVHGGPSGVFTNSFTGGPGIYMVQYFASKGYAVLRPNPRGSTGYGKDFRYANFKDWGYGDFDDLVTGVDKVIEMGIGDKDNQFLMGWSYGGYMTSFAVTKTDRFKAASMGAGLPNLISMVTTTDIPDYLAAHMGGEFWDDYDTFEKHSAMYHIKNVKTPTQVIHGANDLRVPFTQGQEFYVALKRLGVDTEMVVYPRTPHGPTEPKFLADVSDRILTWFEKYRK